jgi:gamma-glutamyl-gamma-aminobutyrate hydrolase PuuD
VIDPGSRRVRIIGSTEAAVNSFHHPAMDRVGEGLRGQFRTLTDPADAHERAAGERRAG